MIRPQAWWLSHWRALGLVPLRIEWTGDCYGPLWRIALAEFEAWARWPRQTR